MCGGGLLCRRALVLSFNVALVVELMCGVCKPQTPMLLYLECL